MAFASYYVLKNVIVYRPNILFWSLAFVVTLTTWLIERTPANDINLRQYPMPVLSFFGLVLVSQHVRVMPHRLANLITCCRLLLLALSDPSHNIAADFQCLTGNDGLESIVRRHRGEPPRISFLSDTIVACRIG